jgi:Mrp family chromosome partitioning ATPase
LLATDAMRDLVMSARARFDLVIIDTPPLLPVTDAAVLSTLVDGYLVVFRYGKTKRLQISHTIRALGSVDARILGCVLNMRPLRGQMADGYGAYGYYAEGRNGLLGRWSRRRSHGPRDSVVDSAPQPSRRPSPGPTISPESLDPTGTRVGEL